MELYMTRPVTKQALQPPKAPRRQNIPLLTKPIQQGSRTLSWSRSTIAKAIKQFDNKPPLDSSQQLSRMFGNLSLDLSDNSSTMPANQPSNNLSTMIGKLSLNSSDNSSTMPANQPSNNLSTMIDALTLGSPEPE